MMEGKFPTLRCMADDNPLGDVWEIFRSFLLQYFLVGPRRRCFRGQRGIVEIRISKHFSGS